MKAFKTIGKMLLKIFFPNSSKTLDKQNFWGKAGNLIIQYEISSIKRQCQLYRKLPFFFILKKWCTLLMDFWNPRTILELFL